MPQLDPAPWFMIFVFSWLVFLTMIPYKVLAHNFPNESASYTKQKLQTESWNWPWH